MLRLSLLLAALIALPGASAPDPAGPEYARATITGYYPLPLPGSGIRMVLRPVYVTTADGAAHTLYFVHAGGDQFLAKGPGETYPGVGSTCDFTTTLHHIAGETLGDGGPDSPIGELVASVRC